MPVYHPSSNFTELVYCMWSFLPLLSPQSRGINLSCVRMCVVVSEERPRTSLLSSFSALFSPLGLASHAVSASFGCRVNSVICLQVSQIPLHSHSIPIPFHCISTPFSIADYANSCPFQFLFLILGPLFTVMRYFASSIGKV